MFIASRAHVWPKWTSEFSRVSLAMVETRFEAVEKVVMAVNKRAWTWTI